MHIIPLTIDMFVKSNRNLKSILKKKYILLLILIYYRHLEGYYLQYTLPKKKGINSKKIRAELVKFYKNSKFIKILKLNSKLGSGNVLNSNICEISICDTRNDNKLIIFSAIDNLVKGASGQAIQNMNLLFKYSETLGLK